MIPARRPMSPVEWGLLLLLSILWGASFFFVEVALDELSPAWLVFLRVSLGAAALHVVMLLLGVRVAMRPALFLQFMVMGLLNNVVPFTLIFWSQTSIDSSLAAILNATAPFWVVLLAHVVTSDERATAGKLAGIAIGWSGVAVMVGPAALFGLGSAVLPQLAVLLATFFYAVSGLYGRRFKALPPIAGAAWQLTGSACLMGLVVVVLEPFPDLASLAPTTVGAVLGLAFASTALAYILFYRILQTAGATNLLLVTLLIPVTAVTLGGLVLGERLGVTEVAGMGLILLGLAVIDGRLVGLLRHGMMKGAAR